jgi:hypothetical protein
VSRTKFWYVNCDSCGNEGSGGEGSFGSAGCDGKSLSSYMTMLRRDGWTFGTKDLCEECNGNGPIKRRHSQSDAAGEAK